MNKSKKGAAITLADKYENPVVSLCPGHVNARAFRKALEAEGWDEGDDPSGLRFEYWKPFKNGRWKKSSPEKPGAQPVTVMDW